MRIDVTKEIIERAERRDSHHCMVADAIHATFPDAQYILVDLQSIRYSKKDERLRYVHLTPLSVQRKIIAFDQGKRVTPFSFQLPPEFKTFKMGWRKNRKQKNRKGRKPYKKTGRKVNIVAYKERAFGLRNIPT